MKKILPAMVLLACLPVKSFSQDWQAVFLLDSRSGYTGNTYLSPYLAEWDRSGKSGYFLIAPLGQVAFASDRFSADFTGGYVFQPFFDDRDSWNGLFGSFTSQFRLSDKVSAGVETGASRFDTVIERDLIWVQPFILFSPSLFTQLRLKTGSSFRTMYNFDTEGGDVDDRYDSYTIELETWPDFRWQLRSSLYGSISDPAANIGFRFSANHRVNRSLKFLINTGLERFGYSVTTDTGGGGFPPIGAPGGQQTVTEADIILRAGLGTSWQLNKNLTLMIQGDVLNYSSSATGDSFSDIHVSGGVRIAMFPSFSGKNKAKVDWKANGSQSVILKLNYKGDGRLFITGEFNDWEKPGIALSHQTGNRYAAQLSLEPGVYEYKILLVEGSDERWIDFSDDTYTVSDGFGGTNGLIFID